MSDYASAQWILALFIGLSALLYAAIFRERKESRTPAPQPEAPQAGWKESILRALAEIEGALHREHPKEAMARFANLVDLYVRQRWGIDPTALTTPQILDMLAGKIPQEAIEQIRYLYKESDWVKFSEQTRQEEHWQKLFLTFRGLLADAAAT